MFREAAEAELRFFDAHVHLQDDRISHCTEQVLEEAKAAGVERFACNGCCEADWDKVHEIAVSHSEVVPNFGLHPWWVAKRSQNWLATLREKLTSCPGAGLGECGLHRGRREDCADLDVQVRVLIQQLRLAKELQRPVSVHCVNAFGKLQEIIQKEGPFPRGLVLHSWMGSSESTRQLAGVEGIFFSISGHICSMAPRKRQPMLQQIPTERLLLETDAPDGLPSGEGVRAVPGRHAAGQTNSPLNHPANIRAVLAVVASSMGRECHMLADAAFQNAATVFKVQT